MPDERDLHELFRRDLDRIALPPPAVWLPGTRTLARSRWRSLLAVSAAAAVIAFALVVAFVIQMARGDLPQVASSPSPSASAEASASPIASPSPSVRPSPSPSASARPLPPSTAVRIDKTLPATGEWALIMTRGYTWSPNESRPDPRKLPAIDSLAAVPISARATTPRDTLYLLSFTSAVEGKAPVDNLLREQFSPDGRRLVLSVIVGEGDSARAALVIVDLVAGTVGALTTDAAYHDHQPAWSPAGDEIAFVRRTSSGSAGRASDAGIWVIRADGTGLRQVLGRPSQPVETTGVYSWNADGSGIGFARGFENAHYQLVGAANGQVTTIGDRSAQGRPMADWRTGSPAFVGAFMEGPRGGLQYLVTADQQGGSAKTVVTGTASDGNTFFAQPRWRPGSDDILYVRTQADTTVQPLRTTSTLFVTDASGRTPREIKKIEYSRLLAAWSPDGRDIVYVEGLGVAGSVHLIAPDGTNDRVVQAFGGAPESYLDWIDLAVLGL